MTRNIAIVSNVSMSDERLAGFGTEVEQIAAGLRQHKPNWHFRGYEAWAGELPDNPSAFDGVVFSGSPASVNHSDAWIADTLDFIRVLHDQRVPMVGICFGHQAIAKALGGTVGLNHAGWALGAVPVKWSNHAPWMQPAKVDLTLYAVHNEQVKQPPEGAEVIANSEGCPVAGFCIGDHVMTTQHHPEIQTDFMEALLNMLETEDIESLDAGVLARARASLTTEVHSHLLLGWIANFLAKRVS